MANSKWRRRIRRGAVVFLSIFLLVTAMIWRVWSDRHVAQWQMLHNVIQQFLRQVDWGELDYLLIDLPPGTGDAALTLTQQAPLSGAVVVTTANDLSLIDARKGLAMFQRVDVPVLGIIENMSYFLCPKCGERSDIFGHGGAGGGGGTRGERPVQLPVWAGAAPGPGWMGRLGRPGHSMVAPRLAL